MSEIRFHLYNSDNAKEFLNEKITPKAKSKFTRTFKELKNFCGNDSSKFKKLKNPEIWEFRVKHDKNYYRLFAFWDKRKRGKTPNVICCHGIIKKDRRTPKREIKRAERLRIKYLQENPI